MWYKGVSFTAEQCALVYLVDAAGTRTTTDTFLDMSQDFTLNVFYKLVVFYKYVCIIRDSYRKLDMGHIDVVVGSKYIIILGRYLSNKICVHVFELEFPGSVQTAIS